MKFLKASKKEWALRAGFGVCFCLIGIILGVLGCGTKPIADAKIVKAVQLLNESTKDYVNNAAQPAIKEQIVRLKTEYDAEKDEARKKVLGEKIQTLIEFYRAGNWLPRTTEELWKWATDVPLEEAAEKATTEKEGE